MNSKDIIAKAIELMASYRQLEVATEPMIIQSFRDDFAEYKRLVGDIMVEWEYKYDKATHERKMLEASNYAKIKTKDFTDTGKYVPGVEITHELRILSKDLRKQEVENKKIFKKTRVIYNALADLQNSCASRMKVES